MLYKHKATISRLLFSSLVISTLFSCNEEPTGNLGNNNPNNPPTNFSENFGQTTNHNFMGQVVDLQNNPVSGASIMIGNSSTNTDNNGIFIVRNAQVFEKFAYVKAQKSGFIDGSRSLVPSSGVNHVKIMLLPQTVTQTVSSGDIETVSLSNGAQVELSGQYSNLDGSNYSGNVQVTLHFLNPTDDTMTQQMPGMLLAQNYQNEARMLETLGMVAVELRSGTGEKLNLSEGSEATISVPLDPETLNVAPNEIPLWYFDEDNGYWIEEGSATLQGNSYVGTVSHFSFWNCDIPTEYVNICINVSDANNTPLSNLAVSIESEFNGTGYGVTNETGNVCGIIPANQVLNLSYFFNGVCNNEEIPNTSQTFGPFSQDVNLSIVLDVPEVEEYLETITGSFNNCDGNAVVNGYIEGAIEGGSSIYNIVTDGVFEINVLSCNENSNLSITGYDYDTLETTGEINYTLTSPETDLGNLSACDSIDEFIQYSIDNSEIINFISNISTSYNDPTLTIYANNNNDCFYLYGILNNNPVGVYDNIISWQSTDPGFTLSECQNISNQNNSIQYNLSQFGSTPGEYIDINFNGDYEDFQGNPHTITGVIHVKRDE
tara:strand:- start:54 stop:1859 length:1806 start_codon:yes stop_codon:yes gene_type:complete